MNKIVAIRSRKEWWPVLLAALSAFCVYTCMYAFRKPFTAAGYEGILFLNIDYKVWLVVAQTIGYTLSKFYGIRFIAEMKNENRPAAILKLIAIAWTALLVFAIVPAPFNIIFLLINGLPLGVIYGLVFSYLEGRQVTELLGAVLATSFIFASSHTLFQIDRDNIARSYNSPPGCPIGHIIPKLRTEAPTALPDLSIIVTS